VAAFNKDNGEDLGFFEFRELVAGIFNILRVVAHFFGDELTELFDLGGLFGVKADTRHSIKERPVGLRHHLNFRIAVNFGDK
jgi:hypothetical protein